MLLSAAQNAEVAGFRAELDGMLDVLRELQRRGIFRKEYESTTLRGHLGLPEAPSQWHREPAKETERGAA